MDEARKQEVRERILEDMAGELRWWWLSFSGDDGFRGVCIVQAGGLVEAAATAARLDCNPGGDVLGMPLDERTIPGEYLRERLLSTEDLEQYGLGEGPFTVDD